MQLFMDQKKQQIRVKRCCFLQEGSLGENLLFSNKGFPKRKLSGKIVFRGIRQILLVKQLLSCYLYIKMLQ